MKDGEPLLDATIMMVDDEPITMEIVQILLEEAGYRHFVMVENPAKAMHTLEEKRPDLLLLDLMMPEISGFDILRSVRAHPKLRHLPVLILTSSSEDNDKLTALDLGATDFLSKPVDPIELRLRVRNTLAAKSYMDQLAFYDPLTKLPNRHLFMEHLDWALKGARRNRENLAVLSIELDQFDKINDTLGLFAGDELLRKLAQRIAGVAQGVDILGDVTPDKKIAVNLFHLEGGVFSLILYRLTNARSAAWVAESIMESVNEPIYIQDTELYLTASIGISTYPTDRADCATMLQMASGAKDYAKSTGGNTFQFSSRQIHTRYQRRLGLEARLRRALDRDELILFYQPQLDVQTNTITGVEALLRWQAHDGGIIPPDKFIPLAEETGLIVQIGEWVLHRACKQLKAWQQAGKAAIGMSVNMSPVQFQSREMPAIFKRVVGSSGIDPCQLTIEVTEGMLLEDLDAKIALMKGLKDLGLKLSIDDFGTGYSSLSYLRKLPLDELKIDRSFFIDFFEDTKSRALVSSMIFLSHNLNLLTVAEGVETEAQLRFLQKGGCDLYQGYLFSRPLPNDKLIELLSPED
ncbi:GGDEF/EAL domain-containing response regulator [Desulfosarcina alkanivorans]|nr:EAL domain-containing response regulator [Desulfosarcina alkanivorans]